VPCRAGSVRVKRERKTEEEEDGGIKGESWNGGDAVSMQIVPYPDEALPLLYASWFASTRRSDPTARAMSGREWRIVLGGRIQRVLDAAPLALALVDPAIPGWIGGWIVAHACPAATVVHYCYVKGSVRRNGYALALLDAAHKYAGEPDGLVTTANAPRWRELLAWYRVSAVPFHDTMLAIEGAKRCE
jgi:hypothetical protein